MSRATVIRRKRTVEGRSIPPFKIVVTGPFSAGKTTLIQTISEVAVLATERDVSDESRSVKNRTTVAMDFGRLSFGPDLTLFIFGTPGQRRFEVMWEILSEGMIGFIVLVNAADHRSMEEAGHILATFNEYADVPFVVGVSHLDEADASQDEVFAKVRAALDLSDDTEMFACDPRAKEDVKTLMLQILLDVMARLERAEARG